MVKVSIITPVFNGERFIEDNIKNIRAQNYANIEHIIIDGGSKDKTVEIIEKYKDGLKYLSEKDKGQSDAINKGFRMATGEIITWLNADDFYTNNNVITKIVEYFEKTNASIISGKCKVINIDTKEEMLIPQPEITFESLIKWWNIYSIPPQPSIFFKKDLLDKYGMIDESLHYCMDHELWLRFLSNKEKLVQVDDILSVYQIYAESKTGSSLPKFIKEHDKVAKRYWGKPWQLIYYRRLFEYLYARYYKFRDVFKLLTK